MCSRNKKRTILQAKIDPTAIVAETACGPMEYSITGQAPYVLFLHGSPGCHDGYTKLAEALEWPKNGFGVIAPSRPGYGRTPIASGRTYPAQADCFAALLDTLKIEKVVVYAVSGGSPAALSFAAQHPSRTYCCLTESGATGSFPHPEALCFFKVFGAFYLSPSSMNLGPESEWKQRRTVKEFMES